MTEPTVACVMLTKDRPAMARRAVECFRRQTYANKRLVVANSGPQPIVNESEDIWEPAFVGLDAMTIGQIRNVACRYAADHYFASATRPDIFCHWDDDDWSHPDRIAEQVALLASSGADAVGYSDLLFWRFVDCKCPSGTCSPRDAGHWKRMLEVCHDPRCPRSSDGAGDEAWLYSRPTRLNVPGTTLCYWRKTWERKPFPHLPEVGNPTSQGEDIVWQAGLKVVAVSSIHESLAVCEQIDVTRGGLYGGPIDTHRRFISGPVEYKNGPQCEPRMIASIHGSNTMAFGYANVGHVEEFARTPEWDSYCARVMEIK